MARDELISIEVALAWPREQSLIAVRLSHGASIKEALRAAGLQSLLEKIDTGALAVGVFGECHNLERKLCNGDRIEIYRPLQADPKNARKNRSRTN